MLKRFLVMVTGLSSAAGLLAVDYVDWQSVGGGENGAVVSGDLNGIGVAFSGGSFLEAQTDGGTDWWALSAPPAHTAFTGVANLPGNSDIVRLNEAGWNTLVFAEPVTDPIMLVLSLGQPWNNYTVSYTFDRPFSILSSGSANWGGDPLGTLTQTGTTLTGLEGSGVIQFSGTFDSITWESSPGENWHGFTIGLAGNEAVPDAGSTLVLLGSGLALMGMARRRLA